MTDAKGSAKLSGGHSTSRSARRAVLLGGLAVLGIGTVMAVRWFNIGAEVTGTDLTAPDALAAAKAGTITLIDIRRPDEWARTGVGQGAIPIDMRSERFLHDLMAQTKGRRDQPIALICARGVRSARVAQALTEAGFTQILDVPEGMMGSGAGPGWLKRGLPVVRAD